MVDLKNFPSMSIFILIPTHGRIKLSKHLKEKARKWNSGRVGQTVIRLSAQENGIYSQCFNLAASENKIFLG